MIQEVLAKCEEIVSAKEYGVFLSYEYDGAYSAKLKIRKSGEERSLGKLLYDIEKRIFLYKKYDNSNNDVFFLNWAIISKLRMVDLIEINEIIKKDVVNRYRVGVRKLCETGDFVNLKDDGYGLQILLKKDNAKCEKMKFNFSKKIYEVER